MARSVFYSFHYARDSWRAGQVKNMGVVEGNTPVSSNEWEQVKRKGDEAIKKWINDTLIKKYEDELIKSAYNYYQKNMIKN